MKKNKLSETSNAASIRGTKGYQAFVTDASDLEAWREMMLKKIAKLLGYTIEEQDKINITGEDGI